MKKSLIIFYIIVYFILFYILTNFISFVGSALSSNHNFGILITGVIMINTTLIFLVILVVSILIKNKKNLNK